MGRARTYLLLLAALVMGPACGDAVVEDLVQQTTPANGATAVSLTVKPQIVLGQGVDVDGAPPGVVLYDITSGSRAQVQATVEVSGGSVTYKPAADLAPLRRYVLEVRQGALDGDFHPYDASDKPRVKLPWKQSWWDSRDKATEGVFQLRFSTLSHPRITAVFQDADRDLMHLHFSQAMDRSSCHGRIQLLDALSKKPVTVKRVVWPSASRAYMELTAPLKTTTLYLLKVDGKALGADLTYLDGNGNGKPGEAADGFCVKFTGFQQQIFSRLGSSKQIPCP